MAAEPSRPRPIERRARHPRSNVSPENKDGTAAMLKADSNLDIVICGLHEIDNALDQRVTHVLSILDPGTSEPAKFAELPDDQLLRLRFHDVIEEDQPLTEAPASPHIEAILKFGAAAARAHHRILIHCHMGISRSTAAAVMLLASHHGDADAAVARVVEIRPVAWPNLRMIELADAARAFDGRLVRAVRRHHAQALRRRPELREAFTRHGRGREIEGLDSLASETRSDDAA
jgi:predicted protein tyrosine phosphatase